ncbi:Multiple ankyrin repeats single kh domain [Mycena kentingensis (nom. inval.)]|nr:Multiple ankyrin repeats single kh domain [Mycena kentingensis (nom. inval.)]
MDGPQSCIVPNTDIAGIGVRVATYAPNFLVFIPTLVALADGKISRNELHTIQTQSITILLAAFALLFAAMIGGRTGDVDGFHAAIALKLSWMNNTNTFVYVLLYVHRRVCTTKGRDGVLWRVLEARHSAHNVPSGPSRLSASRRIRMTDRWEQRWRYMRAMNCNLGRKLNLVLVVGSLHLSVMGALGFWLWLHPSDFGVPKSGACTRATSISIFGDAVSVGSSHMRVISLVVYGLLLPPGLNLVIPTLLLLLPYFLRSTLLPRWLPHLAAHDAARACSPQLAAPTNANDADAPPAANEYAGISGIRWGLALLFGINIVFLIDTELSLKRNAHLQDPSDGGDSQWTFGQTLAILLLVLPLRDAAESILQRVERSFQMERAEQKELRKALYLFQKFEGPGPGPGDGAKVPCVDWDRAQGAAKLITHYKETVICDSRWLYCACADGKRDLVEFLLGHGVNANLFRWDNDRQTPLHAAIRAGHLDVVELLVANGAEAGVRGMCYRCRQSHPCALRRLAWTPSHPSTSDQLWKAEYKRIKGLHVDCRDFSTWTPLLNVADKNYQTLRDVGASRATPLHYAALKGHLTVVRYLIDFRKQDINEPNGSGQTPLHYATYGDQAAVVEWLINRGANVACMDKSKRTPLLNAADQGYLSIVKILCEVIHDLEGAKDKSDQTALHYAVKKGHLDVAEYLIQKGMPVDSKGESIITAMAATTGSLETVQFLVRQKANVDATSDLQGTPLHMAVQGDHLEVVKFLVEQAGANIDARYVGGRTALHIASLNGQLQTMEYLLDRGASIEAREEMGETALLSIADEGNYDLIRLLILRGADINATNDYKTTPLHRAAAFRHAEIVKLFLEHNADVHACGK